MHYTFDDSDEMLLSQVREKIALSAFDSYPSEENGERFKEGLLIGAVAAPAAAAILKCIRAALLALDYNLGPTEDLIWVIGFLAAVAVTFSVFRFFKYRESKLAFWNAAATPDESEMPLRSENRYRRKLYRYTEKLLLSENDRDLPIKRWLTVLGIALGLACGAITKLVFRILSALIAILSGSNDPHVVELGLILVACILVPGIVFTALAIRYENDLLNYEEHKYDELPFD